MVLLWAAARPLRGDESAIPPAVQRVVDFEQDVQPILRARCYECHAAGREEGGLNLGQRARALQGGDGGAVLTAGDSAGSRLIQLVAAVAEGERMPPDGDRLTAEQIGILRAWIDQGMPWPETAEAVDPRWDKAQQHWAFQPLRAVALPPVMNKEWVSSPIDHFILAALEARGLLPAERASPRILLRRMAFDVQGLPPEPALLEESIAEASRDRTQAVLTTIDRLLASHHYGERWARHWLDVARYADSDGMESDADRPHAYQYRDFVIRALNEDLAFDTFIRWQMAGDEIEPENPQAVAATGFLTAGTHQPLEEKLLEEERLRNRYNELDDILSTVGTGILGLTLGCARCHDHKYDAISSREYYQLMCAFHSGERKDVKIAANGTELLAYQDFSVEPQVTWLFGRGDFHDHSQPVQLGFLRVVSRQRASADYLADARREALRSDTTYQRAALATWLTDTEHGAGALAARVIVNRVWQHHFGEGLVRTVNDFGVRGEIPSHPELLEWLAHDFVAHGWKLKRLHRMILASSVYQQSSTYEPAKAQVDFENRLLWCKTPQRLQAEILRDSILAVSGNLNLQAFGPAFKPPIPAEAMVARNTKSAYPADAADNPSTRRRSIYMFHKRVVPYPLLQVFDQPDAQQGCGRRNQTTVAPQALGLLNDQFVRTQALEFADLLIGSSQSEEQLVQTAFRRALGRLPDDSEMQQCVSFIVGQRQAREARGETAAESRRKAIADFCQSLFALNEFIYID